MSTWDKLQQGDIVECYGKKYRIQGGVILIWNDVVNLWETPRIDLSKFDFDMYDAHHTTTINSIHSRALPSGWDTNSYEEPASSRAESITEALYNFRYGD